MIPGIPRESCTDKAGGAPIAQEWDNLHHKEKLQQWIEIYQIFLY